MENAQQNVVYIRKATLADYDDVVNVNTNVNDGLDYIPAMYHQLLHDPDVYPYVGIHKDTNKIICFSYMKLFPDDQILVSCGGRINENYQGESIFKSFQTQLEKMFIPERLPYYKHWLWVQKWWPGVEERQRKETTSYLFRNTYYNFTAGGIKERIHGIQQELSSLETEKVNELSTHDATAALTDEKNWPIFFRCPYVEAYSNWWPFLKTKKNFTQVALTHRVFASYREIKGTRKYSNISFGQLCQVSKGVRYNLFFHGEDTDALIAHVINHVLSIANVTQSNESVYLCLKYSTELNDDKIRTILGSAFGKIFTGKTIKSTFTILGHNPMSYGITLLP